MDTRLFLSALLLTITVVYGQSCVDKHSGCNTWPDSYCQKYQSFMKNNCARKCGYCSGPVTTANPGCNDVQPSSYCRSWKQYGYCDVNHQYHYYMKDNCAQTCGFCGIVTTKPSPTSVVTTKPSPTSGTCSVSQKLQSCSFNGDTCDFLNVPFDDDLDFVEKSSGGPDNSGYISALGRGEARLILPLDLLVPHNGDLGSMCLEFYYRMPSGGLLEVYEVRNERGYGKVRKLRLSAQQSIWTKARVGFHASQRKHLLMVAQPGSGNSIDIDNARFCDSRC